MPPQLHRAVLRVYRWLPPSSRRLVVRLFAPSFTVGAICHIERADGHLLLVRQVYRHRWGFPGGLLDRGESGEAAVRREVREEVGLEIELVGEPAVVVEAKVRRVDLVYRAHPAPGSATGEVRPTSPEIALVGWFAPDALPELQFETLQALAALTRADLA